MKDLHAEKMKLESDLSTICERIKAVDWINTVYIDGIEFNQPSVRSAISLNADSLKLPAKAPGTSEIVRQIIKLTPVGKSFTTRDISSALQRALPNRYTSLSVATSSVAALFVQWRERQAFNDLGVQPQQQGKNWRYIKCA